MRSIALAACAAVLTTTLAGVPASATTSSPAATVAAQPGGFTGYALDACETPSQAQMNAWRLSSPYAGVGVYLAGANRTCDAQTNLNSTWVSTQIAHGWRVLPITVGRQAACYDPTKTVTRIDPDPADAYEAARLQGRAEADATIAASQEKGFAVGTTHWLDIEDFDPFPDDENPDCRRSMLRFVSGWTERLHQLGYKSGLYSNVAAGITAIEGARTLSRAATRSRTRSGSPTTTARSPRTRRTSRPRRGDGSASTSTPAT